MFPYSFDYFNAMIFAEMIWTTAKNHLIPKRKRTSNSYYLVHKDFIQTFFCCSEKELSKKTKKRVTFQSDQESENHSSGSEDFDFAKFSAKRDKEKKGKLKKKKVFCSDSESEKSETEKNEAAKDPSDSENESEQKQ